jgi:serine/threonine-protein kinase RsbT
MDAMATLQSIESRSLSVSRASDVVSARQLGGEFAEAMGFGPAERLRITTAISEITRNVLRHSGATGTMSLDVIERDERRGLLVTVADRGSGIADLASVMHAGESTSVTSLGAGLPSSKRLMDELEIETGHGEGTLVRMIKWLPTGSAPRATQDPAAITSR